MNNTYTFEDLKADVAKEAAALRVHATEEERGRLDFLSLNPTDMAMCIYGQMTGDCDSHRASRLIKNCTSIFIDNNSEGLEMYLAKEFRDYHWSPIEYYILLPEARNANLIAYLRGETDTLQL